MDLKNPFSLKGKIAWINGASRGIGEATAKILACHGAHVICTSRKGEVVSAVAEAIRADGGSAEAMACHTGDPAAIDAVFARIDAAHGGRIDILVNNAGTNPFYGLIGDTPLTAFDKTFEVNLRGPFYASALAVKRMEKTGGGAIVNVASVNGIRPGALQGVYSMTKAAMINMTQAFAMEYGGKNIRVNALCPGLTATKIAGALLEDPEVAETWLKTHNAIQRAATPEEQAAAILYLVSDAASYTTGEKLIVDGGYLA